MVNIKDFEKIAKDSKEIDITEIDIKSKGKEEKFEEIKIKKNPEKKLGIFRGAQRFWKFLRKDSWMSLIVTLIIAFVLIKFIFFPLLSFFTGTALPLVIVESCSMYHSTDLGAVLENEIYDNYNISFEDTSGWSFRNGFSKGDIIFVVGAKNIKVGDVIIFNGGSQHPIIHRVIKIGRDGRITTKGDHNPVLLMNEMEISPEQVIGRAVFRVPFVGWIKLVFFEYSRLPSERGFCS